MSEGDESMDLTGSQLPPKRRRVFVAPEDSSIEDKGNVGQVLNLDKSDKATAHRYVRILYDKVVKAFGVNAQLQMDMLVSHMMIRQVSSVHNCLRSSETASKSDGKLKLFEKDVITLTAYGQTLSANPADLVTARNEAVLEATGAPTLTSKVMGNIQTVLGLWQLWGERMDEVQYGSDYKIRTKKGPNGDAILVRATRFGLCPASRNFWSGLMWSLPVQSALCQSMGPLAVAVRLSDSVNDKYANKWKTTFMRQFNFLPYAPDIAKALVDNKVNSSFNTEVLGLLSKMVVVTGARDVQRVAFPPCFLSQYLKDDKNVLDIDFSGNGAFRAYKAFCQLKFTVPSTQYMTHLKEIVFHAMLGTHVEDFGVLKFMTNYQNWHKRHQINDNLIKVDMKIRDRALKDKINFEPIPIHFYSKMSSAMMQNLLGGGIAPIVAKSVLSGYRTRKVPEALVKYINKEIGSSGGGLGLDDIKSALKKDIRKAMDALSKDGEAGTVKWRAMNSLGEGTPGDTVDHRVMEEGVFFHSQD